MLISWAELNLKGLGDGASEVGIVILAVASPHALVGKAERSADNPEVIGHQRRWRSTLFHGFDLAS